MSILNTIQSRITELDTEMASVRNAVETEQRLLTPEESAKLEKAQSEHAELTKQAKLLNGVSAARAASSEPVRTVARPAMSVSQGSPWKTMGQFAMDVRSAATNASVMQKIMNAASTFSSEGTNADGGYAVPQDLRRDIQQFLLQSPESLLSRCDIQRTFSTSMVFPRDVEQDWQLATTGSYVAEGADYPENKVGVGNVSVSCGKVGHIINATEELINDSLAFDTYLTSKGLRGLQYNVNAQIVSGSGANNLPTGFLAHAACKVVASGTGYTATQKIGGNDLMNMYFGMPAQYRGNAVWLVSDALEPQLVTAQFSGSTLYAQAGSALNPTDTGKIWGRPVIVSPFMKAPGTTGDIAFVDLSKYLALLKSDTSVSFTPYLYWKSDTMSWKFSVRLGGRPWFDAPITLADGSTTRSPFVRLNGGR
jgi:HK97 family phage major capsid protein